MIKIEKIKESRYKPEFASITSFGNTFADHMLICEYKDGAWGDAKIMPFQDLSFSPAMQAIHYGQACFEGMKAYKDKDDNVFMFRPEKNFVRINASAQRLAMPEIPEEVFMDGLKALIDVDRKWVPNKHGMSLYLRPFIFATEPMITARASEEFMFAIITAVAPDYYAKPLKVKIADKFSRAANGGVGFAKAAGNYAASFYPTKLAREEGFDQVIWTDAATHEFIEEAGTMNVFVRIEDKLITAPISERILNGVTRNSIIELAKKNGWEVEERRIAVRELVDAFKEGKLKEVFGCGTAVVQNSFSGIGYKDQLLELEDLGEESWGKKLKKQLVDLQNNLSEDPFGWRVKVEEGFANKFIK
ncbi:branched-chain amino acid aminotransferase [Flavobacteriaceae bacterium Ap0902]|nr:branched-chain amino acid aminotransferase [Flavobacteriaceae bacterium Ap0902]